MRDDPVDHRTPGGLHRSSVVVYAAQAIGGAIFAIVWISREVALLGLA